MPAQVLDLYREHKLEYIAPRKPAMVKVSRAKYLAISGQGAPATPAFQDTVGALYGMAFTIKMARKFAGQNYRVCHLEGLWCTADGIPVQEWTSVAPEQMRWKLLIRVPEFVNAHDLKNAAAALKARGKKAPFSAVKLETLAEGTCVQLLHVGPYDAETASLRQMREFAGAQGFVFSGVHHEIYLSDPRRVAKERLRTILRYPVKKAGKASAARA